MKKLFSLFFALSLLCSCQTPKKEKAPNLLIIQTDEHNFRTLSCYRQTLSDKQALIWGPEAVLQTPNIDWLAENGALCTSFYATSPVCSPSRAAMVSGKYPHHTGVPKNDLPMLDDIVTFAEILRQQGYVTGYAGKWHLDGTGKPQWAPERKFGFEDNRYMFNRGHWKVLKEDDNGPGVACLNQKGEPSYCLDGADEASYTTDFLVNRTIDFIQEHSEEPFCYMLAIPDPHGPNTVRAPYDEMYTGLNFEIPATAKVSLENLPSWSNKNDKPLSQQAYARYFGMVKCIDDNVGRILQTLRETGQLDNTLIVFTSDHGDLLGEHGRHNKGVPLEASAKVAFILHYPPKVQPGTRVDAALSFVDFLPSVLSLLDVPTADQEEGRDAAKLFTSGQMPSDWEDVSFLRAAGQGDGWIAAVTDRYKLVYSPQKEDAPWLIDLEKDPDELINFYADPAYVTIVKDLTKKLRAYGEIYQDDRIHHTKIRAEMNLVLE